MITAKEAREISIKNKESIVFKESKDLKANITSAITQSMGEGKTGVELTAKLRQSDTVTKIICDYFGDLGYKITIDFNGYNEGISEVFIGVTW